MYKRNAPVAERFWSKVNTTGTCWIWTDSVNVEGYGRFKAFGKDRRAHRFAFELVNGPIPSGYHVCHHCDNPSCVRPDHLFLGTDKDNKDDCVKKGRQPKGITNGRAKLNEVQVLEIRTNNSISIANLARRYNVDEKSIRRIRARETWKHI